MMPHAFALSIWGRWKSYFHFKKSVLEKCQYLCCIVSVSKCKSCWGNCKPLIYTEMFYPIFSNLSRTECCGMVHEIGGHYAEKAKQISDTFLYHLCIKCEKWSRFWFYMRLNARCGTYMYETKVFNWDIMILWSRLEWSVKCYWNKFSQK